MKTVLVTGGAGYIGSHACKALARAGYQPVAYDSLENGHRGAVRWGPLEVGNILDADRLDAVLARHDPVAVMHFAAYIEVGESVRDPAKFYRNNTMGALTLLEAMRRRGIGPFVFSSTCAVHGIPAQLPITEDLGYAPINPYGASKMMVERMLADRAAAHGEPWVALRYFNACGADPDGEIGEAHDPESHLIPRALMAVDGALPGLDVFGTDYATPDGTCIRDYIHIVDLALAHVAALEHLLAGRQSCAINLGVGRGFSVREIVDPVARVTCRRVPVRFGARRPGDPQVLLANPARAHALLGFAPRHADIDTIVATAWSWYRKMSSERLVGARE